MTPETLLEIDHLHVEIARRGESLTLIEDVSLRLLAGQRLGLVGESGSGKSITASAILGLLPPKARATSGRLLIQGRDALSMTQAERLALRGRVVGLIPQDPLNSLNPVRRIGSQLTEGLRNHERLTRKAQHAKAVELLDQVGIPNPANRLESYPQEFSGGMRQRVLIAMALALRPKILIADESTTALDVTVQKQVLDLIDTLARENGSSIVLITHDLAVAAGRTDKITVLRHGRVVESGPTTSVLHAPHETYTGNLLAASPNFSRPHKSRFPINIDEVAQ
jgi:peptide/nickel transport system ATP-binding protein